MERLVRTPVRLYLTIEETERLTALAQRMSLTKGQTIKAAIERMYREEMGGGPPGGRSAAERGLDWKA